MSRVVREYFLPVKALNSLLEWTLQSERFRSFITTTSLTIRFPPIAYVARVSIQRISLRSHPFDFYPFSPIIACIRWIKQGRRERKKKIDKYSCRKTQGLRSFTCLLIRHVNRYSTMIHGKLCRARVRYINFLNVPRIRRKTCEPGKIWKRILPSHPPVPYLNYRNREYSRKYSYRWFAILLIVKIY